MVNPVDKFIATFESRSTNKSHRTHLNKFFELLGQSPENYFSSGRNYEDDLTTLWLSMKEYAPGTKELANEKSEEEKIRVINPIIFLFLLFNPCFYVRESIFFDFLRIIILEVERRFKSCGSTRCFLLK